MNEQLIGEILATVKYIQAGVDELKKQGASIDVRVRSLEDSRSRVLGALWLLGALDLFLGIGASAALLHNGG